MKNEKQRIIYDAGRSKFQRYLIFVSLMSVIALLIYGLYRDGEERKNKLTNANRIIENILGHDDTNVSSYLNEIRLNFPELGSQLVKKKLAAGGLTKKKQARLQLVLLNSEEKYSDDLIQRAIEPTTSVEEFRLITFELIKSNNIDDSKLVQTLQDNAIDQRTRFRSICLLLASGKKNDSLERFLGVIPDALLSEPRSSVDKWLDLIAENGKSLGQIFAELLRQITETEVIKAEVYSNAIYLLLDEESSTKTFESIIKNCNDAQFTGILSTIEKFSFTEKFAEYLSKVVESQASDQSVDLAVALFRLGLTKMVENSLSGDNEETRVQTISKMNPNRIRFSSVKKLFELSNNDLFQHSSIIIAAEFAESISDNDLKNWLIETCRNLLYSSNCGSQAAAELVLRRLGINPEKFRLAKQQLPFKQQNTYVNKLGQLFSIVDVVSNKNVNHRIAFATKELSVGQYRAFLQSAKSTETEPVEDDELPFRVTWYKRAYEYCNWLTIQDGLGVENLCYPTKFGQPMVKIRSDKSKKGYRLPTVDEWIQACRANDVLAMFPKKQRIYLTKKYAWTFDEMGGNTAPVGRKFPDKNGIFDCFGNLSEPCEIVEADGYTAIVTKGKTSRNASYSFSTVYSTRPTSPVKADDFVGLRVVRNLD